MTDTSLRRAVRCSPATRCSSATSRGRALPIDKALHPDTLLAAGIAAGAPLPVGRGGPVPGGRAGLVRDGRGEVGSRGSFVLGPEDSYDDVHEAVDHRIATLGDDGPGERMTAMPIHPRSPPPGRAARVDRLGRRESRGG